MTYEELIELARRLEDRPLITVTGKSFTVAEVSEALAAARGLALPSQLRRMLRDQGRDVHNEFLNLLPSRPRPIRIQRWGARRVTVLLLMVPAALLLAGAFRTVLVNNDATTTPLAVDRLYCDEFEPLVLEAQSVQSASAVPCVRSLPEGWTFGAASVTRGLLRNCHSGSLSSRNVAGSGVRKSPPRERS